ncbi:MAG: hypothetical protein F4026_06840 [Synechococcus sp. SB0669_bin_8]|nr:hypothetical protein [Synechococcus sp. SB0669_bin_8]
MLNLPPKIRSAPAALPLAVALSLMLPLTTACSGRGSQASSPQAQTTEASLQDPVEQASATDAPAQPLLAIESSPPAPSHLHRAAMAGDVEQVKQLLDQGHEIHQQHARGLSALHEAVRKGHGDVVAVFMAAGADPDDPTALGKTPLHLAAATGSVEMCNILLEAGADPALVDQDGVTALGVAVREGHTEMVRLLVDNNPYLFSDRASGALFHDAALHGHTEILAFLVEAATAGRAFGGHYGFSINRGNPLHAAAANGHTDIARLLLRAGASLTAEDDQGQTPFDLATEHGHDDLAQILKQSIQLSEAVENGDGEQVGQLLAGGVPVEARRDSVATPLHLAVLAGQTHMAQLLIDAGANVNAVYLDLYRTPLMLAAIEGNADMVQLLIEAGAELDAQEEGARTALLLAIAALENDAATMEPVRLLLRAGADPSIGSRYGTPLSNAIEHGATELVDLLIQAGVHVNAADRFGSTPLHEAASPYGYGDHEAAVRIAEALIQAGANVNPPPSTPSTFLTGGTPLSLAAGTDNLAMVRLLIEHGADVQARGRLDAPLHVAARSGNADIAQALIEAGADLHARNVNYEGDADNSPLHLAIHAGHGDLARLLIEAGADVQARNHAGNPPVQVAAFAGLPEVIKLLVEAGSPVNLQDQVGDTPLHDAALKGQVEAARVLLEAGADVHAKNNAGKTPLDLARQHGHESVAAVLQAAGGS